MKNDSTNIKSMIPPSEEPGTELLSEEAHTDPGTDSADSFEPLDWNNAEDRYEMIAEAAYYKAEQRGFEIGEDELDWLEAEQELLDLMGPDPAD